KIKQKKGVWINSYFLNKKWEKILTKIIKEEKQSVIITQDYLVPSSVKIAKRYNIKSIVFLRSYMHLSIDGFMSYLPEEKKPGKTKNLSYKIQYPFYKLVIKKYQKDLKDADLVCSVSNYVRDVTFNYLGVNSEVIRPFVKIDAVENNGEFIAFINPDIHKGLDIFKQIVKRLPDKKFLVAGKEINFDEENVKVIKWADNIKEIYSKTKLLLVPSLWPDPCPRVCIEAMANGIPFVVSNRGGLTEMAKDCGIVVSDPYNINEWAEAITKFDNKEFYDDMTKKAKWKYLEFGFNRQFNKFELLLKNLFKH
ncbi:glycosyltransferase family 4 protein, partial [Candidatus Woesearchaeota archaeon]|nr:glycosyltransferase family 4 protein [Candidatus Woesearchaeota archaeon]